MEKTQSQYSKEYIVEALFALMKKENFTNISVADICKKAGVSRATYYRYFKTKKDVIIAFFRYNLERYLEAISKYDKRDYRNNTYEFFKNFKENEEQLIILEKNNLLYYYMECITLYFAKSYRQKFGDYKVELIYIYSGAVYNYSIWWLNTGFEKSIDEVVDDFIACFHINNNY